MEYRHDVVNVVVAAVARSYDHRAQTRAHTAMLRHGVREMHGLHGIRSCFHNKVEL